MQMETKTKRIVLSLSLDVCISFAFVLHFLCADILVEIFNESVQQSVFFFDREESASYWVAARAGLDLRCAMRASVCVCVCVCICIDRYALKF